MASCAVSQPPRLQVGLHGLKVRAEMHPTSSHLQGHATLPSMHAPTFDHAAPAGGCRHGKAVLRACWGQLGTPASFSWVPCPSWDPMSPCNWRTAAQVLSLSFPTHAGPCLTQKSGARPIVTIHLREARDALCGPRCCPWRSLKRDLAATQASSSPTVNDELSQFGF